MIQALNSAAMGLSSQQIKLDTIANNIANVNTVGFKGTDVYFKDSLYTAIETPDSAGQNLQKGTGVLPGITRFDFTQGNISATGSTMDFAISGDGFFSLQNSSGETVYTRNGSFSVSAQDDGNYLTADNGAYVLDSEGNRIKIKEGESAIAVAADGTIEAEGENAIKLGVYEFENTEGLEPVGNNTFVVTESSGNAAEAKDFSIRQGSIERSNVDLSSELTQLIQTQRMYSLSSRALQTADEMEGLAINVRR